MNIIYLNRSKKAGFSISKVFKTIVKLTAENHEVTEYYMPYFGASPYKILLNLLFVLRKRRKGVVFHVTGDIHYILLALIGCKTILTIHDTVILKNAKNKFDYFFKWLLWFYLPVKIANSVVCISEKTKTDLLQIVKKRNIAVIYNAIDESFLLSSHDEDTTRTVILHIGTGWNKNLNNVSKSLKGLKCALRIIGKLNVEQVRTLKENGISYSNDYSLTDEEIVQEYRNCNIVSFPSFFEGFGMPIIEGQATGRAVLTSKINPLLEVGRDSVHYVNPEDVNSIREGFIKLLNDNVYKQTLIQKGRYNVLRFTPYSIVSQYDEIYKNL